MLVAEHGSLQPLYCKFVTPMGLETNVSDAKVALYKPFTLFPTELAVDTEGIAVLPPAPMTRLPGSVGVYGYDFLVPESLPPGEYAIRFTGTVLGDMPEASKCLMRVVPRPSLAPGMASIEMH